tara:strand:- start:126 stop:404 length:279 start_codon:yes stop_codon:yes gene_type:complete
MELARRQEPDEEDENIIELIIKLMTQAQDFVDKNGIEKKAMVMNNLKFILGQDVYVKNYVLIQQTIDFICKIAKGEQVLDFKKIKKHYLFCC